MKIRATLAAFALAAAGLMVTAAPAQAAPVDGGTFAGTAVDTPRETGCPASNELFVVADLQATQLGLTLPTDIDAAGNNNGLICGKPLSANAQEQFCNNFVGGCPVDIVYYWRDDDLVPG